MKLRLTDRFCDRARPRSGDPQTDYFDATVSGLALRVAAGGRKTWTLHFTSPHGGKRARMTLGTYPATSLGSARTRALEAREVVEAGRDPRTGAAEDTLKAICEEYFRRDGRNLRSKGWREKALDRLVYPVFGDRRMGDIKRSEIVRLLDTIEDENGPVMADRTLAVVRKIMNWQATRSDEFRSPIVRGMARTKPKERARARLLSDDEIRDLWLALDAADVPACYPAFVRILLTTATRRDEAAKMRWDEIDGDTWTIPAARYKTKTEHTIPLSDAAKAPIGKRPKDYAKCPFVFSTTEGEKPFSGYSKAKAALDKKIAELRTEAERDKIEPWTLHDLRRTARSLMSRAGVPSDHAERALGHTMAGVRGTYDRHEFYDEKRQAFEALAGQIDRIVRPQPNVVAMRESTKR